MMKRFMIILYATLSMFAFSANAGIATDLTDTIDAHFAANPLTTKVEISFIGDVNKCVLTKDFEDGRESVTTVCPSSGEGYEYFKRTPEGQYVLEFDTEMADTNYRILYNGTDISSSSDATLKLFISEVTKTTKNVTFECLDGRYNGDCNGSIRMSGLTKDYADKAIAVNTFADNLEASVVSVAKSEANKAIQAQTPLILQTANENAQGYANAGRDAAIKHANDMKAAINKDVNGKLETLETSVNDSVKASDSAKSSADSANSAVATLAKTVTGNKTDLTALINKKTGEAISHADELVTNLPAPELSFPICDQHHYMTSLDGKALTCVEKYLAKGSVTPSEKSITNPYNIKDVSFVKVDGNNNIRIYFTKPIQGEYIVSAILIQPDKVNARVIQITAKTSEYVDIASIRAKDDYYSQGGAFDIKVE
ncbi:MAG TPA: hypothetical protein DCL21_06195 [Alphaproteobacteria bacterium]|nr:hypothetical protein [Alphaproteobacteria bacterium]